VGYDRDEFWRIAFEFLLQVPYDGDCRRIALGASLRILSAHLHDYLSFRDGEPIKLREGINLVVGINNSGKSALLKALNPTLPALANRSDDRFRKSELPPASVTLQIETSGNRLERAALDIGVVEVPLPNNIRHSANQQEIDDFCGDFFKKDRINFSIPFHGDGNMDRFRYPAHGLFEPSTNTHERGFVRLVNKKGKLCFEGLGSDNYRDSVPAILSSICREDIFNFSAERLNVGESGFINARRLSHNADNLPAFLLTLMGEKGSIIERLKEHLRAIFPIVGNFSVRPNDAGKIEIAIWPTEAMDRPELSFPLSESGTGLGQVLAILSVVMTTTESVVIIDEINSFLHPGAVKALLRLFQTEYTQHQYIISTHSPEVISSSNPSTLHLVQRRGYRSSVRALNLSEVKQLREVTQELGISMADVFAADRILWVEGPTEEFCFPEIYRFATQKALPSGYKIHAVIDTGRLTARKNKELVFDIYRRLSDSSAPMVSDVKFSLDAEELSINDKDDLIRASGGRVEFLPRRQLECYLVHPRSILDFIAEREQFKAANAAPLTAAEVETTLMRLAAEKKFKIPEWQGKLDDVTWLTRVDAANLIKAVCEEISGERVTFNKKLDSLALLRLIIKNDPSQLKELCHYVCRLVDEAAG
jgi:hypothetical protein